MSARRAILSVPASEPSKVSKAAASPADEIVVDLEDAVALDAKGAARANIAGISLREHGRIAVRVNASDTSWFRSDVEASWLNPAVDSIVVPKAETAEQFSELDNLLDHLARQYPRDTELTVQALVESASGVLNASSIAASSQRLHTLILGYADLAASLGRQQNASWQYAQDAVMYAARAAGIQAIDGPVLTVLDDDKLHDAAAHAQALGFDGKWVIHPRQLGTVLEVFTPSDEDIADAQGVLLAMENANRDGRGAVEWKGHMLDEALALQARRVLARLENS